MSSDLFVTLSPGGTFAIVEPGEYGVASVGVLDFEHGALGASRFVFGGLVSLLGGDDGDMFAEEVGLWRFGGLEFLQRNDTAGGDVETADGERAVDAGVPKAIDAR